MAKEKGAAPETPEETPVAEGPTEVQESERTYTEKEFQSEADRRVTNAVKKALEEAERKQAELLEEERRKAEAERLAEQGQYKELHEKSQSELDALKAKVRLAEERDAIHKALTDAGLSEYEDVLISAKKAPSDYVNAAKALGAMVKELADAEVAKRLETGKKATGGDSGGSERNVRYKTMEKAV